MASPSGPPPNLPGVKIEPKLPQPPPAAPTGGSGPTRPPTLAGQSGQIGMQKPAVSSPPPPAKPLPTQSPLSGATESRILDSSSKPSGLERIGTTPPMSPHPLSRLGGTTEGTAKPSPVQEYRSSIRTMSEDIASIKSGQKPSGVDVPRRVTPDMPKVPEVPRPEAPAPSGPTPSVGLGRTEKTAPLPGLPKPAVPPSRPGPTAGLGQAGKTGPLPPPAPKKPAEPSQTRLGPFKVPEIQPLITVPSEKKGPSTTLYLLIAGILVIGGFLYWFLVLRVTEPEVVLTPTPTQTVAPTPVVRNLSDIFRGDPVNFEVVLSDNLGRDFKTFVGTLSVAAKEFLQVDLVENVDGTLVPLNFIDMLDMDLTIYPTALRNNIADSIVVVYGQSETFNVDGSINFNAQGLKRTAFVARVRDGVAVETMMKDWELTIANDLADYLLIADTSKESSVNFLDNTYRGVSIKYKNFPFSDTTVDHAVVKAVGQSYLVVAGSREAIYAAIDVLLEQ